MSTEKLGEKLRKIREKKNLPLRKVAALIDVDIAILSKMERGERKLSKEIVLKLANVYNYNTEEIMVFFLTEKILQEIEGEALGEKALKEAEKKVKHLNAVKIK